MECARIQKLLSEYIDNALNAKAKALVDEHILQCHRCAHELASLKEYSEHMATLEEKKAPDDFLEKVHARLNRRFEFEKMMRKVFVPVRFKVPVQLVTVAATIVLVISVYRFIQPPVDTAVYTPKGAEEVPLSEGEKLEEAKVPMRVLQHYEPYYLREGSANLTLNEGGAGKLCKQEAEPIELALLVYPKEDMLSYKIAGEEKEMVADKTSTVERYESQPVGLASDTAAPKAKAVSPLEGIVIQVKGLIDEAGGRVVSTEYEKGTTQPQFLNVEIPSQNYSAFCESLTRIGSPQEPIPTVVLKDQETVLIRIKLILSE